MNGLKSTLLSFTSTPEPADMVTVDGITVPRELLDEALGLADFHSRTHFVGRIWLNTGQFERGEWEPESLAKHLGGYLQGKHSLNTSHRYLNSWICSPDHDLMKTLCGNWLWVPPAHAREQHGFGYTKRAPDAAPVTPSEDAPAAPPLWLQQAEPEP